MTGHLKNSSVVHEWSKLESGAFGSECGLERDEDAITFCEYDGSRACSRCIDSEWVPAEPEPEPDPGPDPDPEPEPEEQPPHPRCYPWLSKKE